ncbi:phosphopantothenoylcysteine decarboxylase [Actinopolymorpha alba]|uniref:phosphopantothenoylcysteine decarboxylase domain-containing protein n=1 Tax=Actinopolymorpha alba TaxID=533267 RepID=UPI0012F6EB26
MSPRPAAPAARLALSLDPWSGSSRTAGGTAEPIDPVRVITNRHQFSIHLSHAGQKRSRGAESMRKDSPDGVRAVQAAHRSGIASGFEHDDGTLLAVGWEPQLRHNA